MNMNFSLNFVSVPTPSPTSPPTTTPTPTTPTTTSVSSGSTSSTVPSMTTTTTKTPPIITSSTSSCSSPSSLMSTSMSTLTPPATTTTTISTLPCSTPSTPTPNNSLLAGNSIHLNYNTTNGDSDLHEMIIKTCSGCRQAIVDRYYSVFDDRNWHSRCLICNECGCNLERRGYVRNGLIYCKMDYLRLFSFRSCAKCCQIIEPDQLVMKVNSGHFYHIDCFTCSQCYCILHKNDYYGLIEGKIYCSDHYSLVLRETALQSLTISNSSNNPPTPTPNNMNGGNPLNHLNHNFNNTNSLTNHRGPSSLSSASPVSSLSSPSSSLSINYHHQQQQQQSQPPPLLHQLSSHHHHHHQQPLHLLQQNVLNSTNPMSPISNHLHHHNSTTPNTNNHLNHHHLLSGGGTNIKSEPLFNTANGNSHKSSTEPIVQVRQTTRGRPRRKLKKEPIECNNNNNNNTNSTTVNNDSLSHSIENQHQGPPSHLLHPPPTSTSSSSTSSSHTENVFHDHLHGLGCPVDSLPGNLHEPRLGLTKSPSSCPLSGLNGQSTNSNHGSGGSTTNGGSNSNGSSNSKSKRVRTSFKHAQLKTMKSYFAINQNPDAKDLKGLAAKTGLSKRVLQVWFQNARAKWRKTSANTKKDSNSETALVDTSSQHSQNHQHHESSGSFSIDYYCKEPFESTGDCDDTLIHHLHSNSLTSTPSSHLHQSQQQQSQLHMPHQFEQSQLPHHPPSLSSTDDEDLNNL